MRLSLSSSAAPEASLEELLAGCLRRGLHGLELSEGHAHALSLAAAPEQASRVAARARQTGVHICAYHRPHLDRDAIDAAAALAAALEAPLVVPLEGFDRTALPRAAEAFEAAGARIILAIEGDPRVAEAVRWLLEPLPHAAAVGLAWEVRPGVDDPSRLADVLDAAGGWLSYLRLFGGGPESQAQSGLGVGPLLASLALRRYGGPLVLTPSRPSYHYAWNAWLGRAGGWGCGSKQSDPGLFTMETPAHSLSQQQ